MKESMYQMITVNNTLSTFEKGKNPAINCGLALESTPGQEPKKMNKNKAQNCCQVSTRFFRQISLNRRGESENKLVLY